VVVRIRAEGPGDEDAVRAVVTAAFDGRTSEAALVDALRAGGRVALALVAEDDGAVVAHVLFSLAAVGAERVLALAPLAVAPAQQRQGIGSALVREGLARAGGRKEPLVVVLGDPVYYARFGFRPAGELGVDPPFERWRPAFQAVGLPAYRPVSGTAIYPPEFEETGTL
jgi:putative acetyltransferase